MDEDERDQRMDAQYFYYGGPWDGKPFQMGPGALIPLFVLPKGPSGGMYAVNRRLRRFEWQPAENDSLSEPQ